jgi:hypothetical protein
MKICNINIYYINLKRLYLKTRKINNRLYGRSYKAYGSNRFIKIFKKNLKFIVSVFNKYIKFLILLLEVHFIVHIIKT